MNYDLWKYKEYTPEMIYTVGPAQHDPVDYVESKGYKVACFRPPLKTDIFLQTGMDGVIGNPYAGQLNTPVTPRLIVEKITDWTSAKYGDIAFKNAYSNALSYGKDPVAFAHSVGYEIVAFRPPVNGESYINDSGGTIYNNHNTNPRLIVVKKPKPTAEPVMYSPLPVEYKLVYKVCTKEQSMAVAFERTGIPKAFYRINNFGEVVVSVVEVPGCGYVKPMFVTDAVSECLTKFEAESAKSDPTLQQKLVL